MKDAGWNRLCEFVWTAKPEDGIGAQIVLRKAFEQMIAAYMEHVAQLLGYDPRKIDFWVDPESDIDLRLVKDVAKEWLTYPGRWQDWPENN